MLNVLKKNSKYTYIPGTPGTPGSAYVPAIPAHYETVTVCNSPGSIEQLIIPHYVAGVTYYYIAYVNHIASTSMAYFVTRAEAEAYVLENSSNCSTVQIYIAGTPAIPGVAPVPPTAAQTLIDNNVGWNAGAISALGLSGDGGFLWKVGKTSSGAVVGFAAANEGVGLSDIKHGFYYTSSAGLKVIEAGVTKTPRLDYSEGDALRVIRLGGVVTYWINDASVYTSITSSTGWKYLDVSLYSAGDYVYDPDMFEVMHLSATASATTHMSLSRELRGGGGSASASKASIRNGSGVDLRVLSAAATSAQSDVGAVLQLSAKS